MLPLVEKGTLPLAVGSVPVWCVVIPGRRRGGRPRSGDSGRVAGRFAHGLEHLPHVRIAAPLLIVGEDGVGNAHCFELLGAHVPEEGAVVVAAVGEEVPLPARVARRAVVEFVGLRGVGDEPASARHERGVELAGRLAAVKALGADARRRARAVDRTRVEPLARAAADVADPLLAADDAALVGGGVVAEGHGALRCVGHVRCVCLRCGTSPRR